MDCPKCGRKGFEGDECPSCGVIVSKYLEARAKRQARLDASLSRLKREGSENQGREIRSSKFSPLDIIDFGFEKIYMAHFLKVIYAFGMIFFIVDVIAQLQAGSESKYFDQLFTAILNGKDITGAEWVIIVFLRTVVSLVLFRMFLEFFILICRIEKHLRAMRYSEIDEEELAE